MSNNRLVMSSASPASDSKFPTVGLKSLLQNSDLLDLLMKPLESGESETIAKSTVASSNAIAEKTTSSTLSTDVDSQFASTLSALAATESTAPISLFDTVDLDQILDLKTKSLFEFDDECLESKSSKSDADASKNYGSAFLGPNLWDKTDLFQGEKLKFEYLEMDDFLTENGLDAADVELLDQKIDNQPLVPPTTTVTTASSNTTSDIVTINTSKANIASNTSVLNSISTISIHAPVTTTVQSSPVQTTSPSHQSPYGGKIASSNSSSLSGYEYGFSPRGGDMSSMMSASDSSVSSDDYDSFNPGMRKFTDEELKPQPMLKKSKKVTRFDFLYEEEKESSNAFFLKQTIPSEMKDDKYWQRRRKNNVAAKRSRDARRVKENHIALRASYLEKENDLLRKQLEESRNESRQLKSRLSHYEAIHQAAGAKGSPN